ncbi:MAG: ribose-5-phosphate isomerase RpiA [Candidatus Thermoplasmatota archaeon]|nr:ribose-5-phosphate isomerase RpiA [Candidatus Thermoplasmatota archaeon]
MEKLKKMAACHVVRYVEDGMVVGLGTGSTVKYAIKKIGEMVKKGVKIIGIPTSLETEKLARNEGITLSTLNEHEIDITIDGADQVDENLNLIKGGGGALLREKMVASCSKKEIIIVDESKIVESFSFPLPVEVVKFGWKSVVPKIKKLGFMPELRGDFVTDNGNYILDCKYKNIENVGEMEKLLNNVPGVVENGLFIDLATEIIVGTADGAKSIRRQ